MEQNNLERCVDTNLSNNNSTPIIAPAWAKWWLAIIIGMVCSMVIVGGATRLTQSGLSMVQWQPLTILPPTTNQAWVQEFENYQAYPQFKKLNNDMDLKQFKFIYYWEYFHRLLGRLLGLILLLPLVFGWRQLPTNFRKNMVAVVAVCALQGFVGWWMVRSGLKSNPYVSPLRLAVHLSIAFIMLAMLATIWKNFCLSKKQLNTQMQQQSQKVLPNHLLLGFISITVFYGAVVAGLKAGNIYNTFPLMGDRFIPIEIFHINPWWHNLFYNSAMVQLIHRCLAMVTVGVVWYQFIAKEKCSVMLVGAVTIQLALGIITLLMQVPLPLALIHQGWAMVVWLVLWLQPNACKN